MFNEAFFHRLDDMVEQYRAGAGHKAAAVLVRTRLGTFSVARVHASELLAMLRVYPPEASPPSPTPVPEGASSTPSPAGDAVAPTAPPSSRLQDPKALPIAIVPYAEIILVEVTESLDGRGYVGSDDELSDPPIGFGRD